MEAFNQLSSGIAQVLDRSIESYIYKLEYSTRRCYKTEEMYKLFMTLDPEPRDWWPEKVTGKKIPVSEIKT